MDASVTAIIVAGASRGVGFEVVKKLRQQNLSVLALIHSDDAQPFLAALGAQSRVVDALDPAAIATALETWCDTPFALVTTVGGTGMERNAPRADYWGNRNLVDAVKPLPCQRFLLVSALEVGHWQGAESGPEESAHRPVLLAKTKAEQHLISSGLPYTILRLGHLHNAPATGTATITGDAPATGILTRLDAADCVVRCLRSSRAVNQVLCAVDRTACAQALTPFPLA
jgi:nucleoside-diphosphate-sugar epimerase